MAGPKQRRFSGYPRVQGIQVDVEALRSLAHDCDPAKCRVSENCCKRYEVLVDDDQIPTIVGSMPNAAVYASDLIDHGDLIDPFDETDDGHCLNTHEDGLCVFAYRTPRGVTLCSLHSAATDLGLPPAGIKPTSCSLWPLFLCEPTPPILTVQDDAYAFPCNSPRTGAPKALDPGVADIARAMFGQIFLAQVEQLLAGP